MYSQPLPSALVSSWSASSSSVISLSSSPYSLFNFLSDAFVFFFFSSFNYNIDNLNVNIVVFE